MVKFETAAQQNAFDMGYKHYQMGSAMNLTIADGEMGEFYRAGWDQAKKNEDK